MHHPSPHLHDTSAQGTHHHPQYTPAPPPHARSPSHCHQHHPVHCTRLSSISPTSLGWRCGRSNFNYDHNFTLNVHSRPTLTLSLHVTPTLSTTLILTLTITLTLRPHPNLTRTLSLSVSRKTSKKLTIIILGIRLPIL